MPDDNLQISYVTDELSRKEFDTDGGFILADDRGNYLIDHNDISHDPTLLIQKLIKIKYGGLPTIKAKRISIQKKLEELDKIEKYLTKG